MTNKFTETNETVKNLLKASLVGILAVVINVIPFEQFVAQFAGLSYAEFRGGMPTLYHLPLFLIYAVIGLVLARIKQNLNIGRRGAFLIIFSFHYVITSFLGSIEGLIYLPDFTFISAMTSGFILAVAVVVAIFYLWKQDENPDV